MTLNYLAQISKGITKAAQEFRLTNFNIEEVSVVDRTANLEEWIVIKGLNMSTEALQEIIGDGIGDFVAKLSGGAPQEGNKGTATPPGTPAAAPVLKLAAATKAATLEGLGTILKGLIATAQIIDKAETPDDGATRLPEELSGIVKNSALALGEMVGIDLEAASKAVTPGVDPFAAELEQTKAALSGLLKSLGSPPAAAPEGTPAGTLAPAPAPAAANPEVFKALEALTAQLGTQGELLTKMAGRVGAQAASVPESIPLAKDKPFVWDYDLNNPQRAEPDAYLG